MSELHSLAPAKATLRMETALSRPVSQMIALITVLACLTGCGSTSTGASHPSAPSELERPSSVGSPSDADRSAENSPSPETDETKQLDASRMFPSEECVANPSQTTEDGVETLTASSPEALCSQFPVDRVPLPEDSSIDISYGYHYTKDTMVDGARVPAGSHLYQVQIQTQTPVNDLIARLESLGWKQLSGCPKLHPDNYYFEESGGLDLVVLGTELKTGLAVSDFGKAQVWCDSGM